MLLYVIGFVAGLIAGISPCILPVLPIILVAGTTGISEGALEGSDDDRPPAADDASENATTDDPSTDGTPAVVTTAVATTAARRRSYRAYAVIAGLIVSFSIVVLAGSTLLSALHLPQSFLRDAGFVVLGAVAVGLIFPPIGHLLERPFARLARRQPTGNSGTFVLGLGLGVVFAPCAGPVLAAITAVGTHHDVSLSSVVLTVDFAAGAAVPLLIFALAGQRVGDRVAAFRSHAPLARRIGGVVMLVTMLLIAFNVTRFLTDVPGYTSALQNHLEASTYARQHLQVLTKENKGKLADCQSGNPKLIECGTAPAFKGITAWLNTPGDNPLTIKALRGKVVLVDFWTYSCINCQRSLPHVEGWYRAYHDDGLEVIGVHTPEFSFEHVVSERAPSRGPTRGALPHRRRRQCRHVVRVLKRVLAGRVPHRRKRRRAPRRLRRGQLPARPSRLSASCSSKPIPPFSCRRAPILPTSLRPNP